jgi:hypothetical protein
MKIRNPDGIRPELVRFLEDFRGEYGEFNYKKVGKFLGTSAANISQQKFRGYLSVKNAIRAEKKSKGKYKAYLLCKDGAIDKNGKVV